MPFEQRVSDLTSEQRVLAAEVERVVREQNAQSTRDDEPRVIWEENRFINRVHVTVVWDRWEGVDPEARSRIIVDAVERTRGPEVASRLSLALGVTSEQAQRMGIH